MTAMARAVTGSQKGSVERGAAPRALVTLACIGLASLGSSCNLDPVHHAAEAALGDEDSAAYPVKSEYHRPGEPCVLCHSERGSAKPTFSLGGTIFWGPDSTAGGVPYAYVRITDGNGVPLCVVTNCAGNFFIQGDQKSLTFPLAISVSRARKPGAGDEADLQTRTMNGHIGREASCANCHLKDIVDFGSPGNVRLYSSSQELEAAKANGAGETIKCPPESPPPTTLCPEDRE